MEILKKYIYVFQKNNRYVYLHDLNIIEQEAQEVNKNAERYFLVQESQKSILDTISQDFIKEKKEAS